MLTGGEREEIKILTGGEREGTERLALVIMENT